MSEWQAGAKRVVITEDGRRSWSVRRETWTEMPGIAPAPWFEWEEDEGTYFTTHDFELALAGVAGLMTNDV